LGGDGCWASACALESFFATSQEIYDHTTQARPPFPGAPDDHRRRHYEVAANPHADLHGLGEGNVRAVHSGGVLALSSPAGDGAAAAAAKKWTVK